MVSYKNSCSFYRTDCNMQTPTPMSQFATLASELLDLRNLIKCPVCRRLLRDPIELKCNHIFCTSCIQMQGRLFTCPICRTRVSKSNYRTAQETSNAIKFLENLSRVKEYCTENYAGEMASGEPPNAVQLKKQPKEKKINTSAKKANKTKSKVNRKCEKENQSGVESVPVSINTKLVKNWLDNSVNDFSRQSQTQQEEFSDRVDALPVFGELASVSQSRKQHSPPTQDVPVKKKEAKRKNKSTKRLQVNNLETPLEDALRIEEINTNGHKEQISANVAKSSKRKQPLGPLLDISRQSAWSRMNKTSNSSNVPKKLKVKATVVENLDENVQTSEIDSQIVSQYSSFMPKRSEPGPSEQKVDVAPEATSEQSRTVNNPSRTSITEVQENYLTLMQHFTNLRAQCQTMLSIPSNTVDSPSTSSMLAIIDKHLLHLEPKITKINELFSATGSNDGTLADISISRTTQTEDIAVQCISVCDLPHGPPEIHEKSIQTERIVAEQSPARSPQKEDDVFTAKTQELNTILLESNAGFSEVPLTAILWDLQRNSTQGKRKSSENIQVIESHLINEAGVLRESPIQSNSKRIKALTSNQADGEEEDEVMEATLVNQFIRPDITLRFESQTQQSPNTDHYLEAWEPQQNETIVDAHNTQKSNRNAADLVAIQTQRNRDEHSSSESSKPKSTLHNIDSDVIYSASSDSISSKILDAVDKESHQNIVMRTPEKQRQAKNGKFHEIASDEDVIYDTPETTPQKKSRCQTTSPDVVVVSPPPAFQDDAPLESDDSIFISRQCRPSAQDDKENISNPSSWILSPIPRQSPCKVRPKSSLLIRRITSTPKSNTLSPQGVEKTATIVTPPVVQKSAVVSCTRLPKEQLIAMKALTHHKLATFSNVFDSNTTHMVVSITENNCVRDHTIKYVCAVAAGLWVVNFKWVQDSFANGKLMPEEEYEVKDVTGVEGPKMSRLSRLQSGATLRLLSGFKFYIAPPILSATLDEILNVIDMLGGVTVNNMNALLAQDEFKCIIIAELLTESYEKYEDWLVKYRTVTVDLEWLTRSVGQFKLLSLLRFALCSDEPLESLGYPRELLTVEPYTNTFSTV